MNNNSRLAATARCMNSNVRPTTYLQRCEKTDRWAVISNNSEPVYFDDREQARQYLKFIR